VRSSTKFRRLKTKNKSGKQKNVMSERKKSTRENAMLSFLEKHHHSKKSKLKIKEPTKIMSAKVTIIGNLGRNPETRINANKTFIANFSFASNNQRKSATGETVKKADWYNITATGKQAQILAKHVRKGDPLLIEGRQTLSEWTDREGNSRKSVDVLVQDFRFLGTGNRNDENQAVSETAGSQIPDDIREAMHTAPDDLDFSGDNFPAVM